MRFERAWHGCEADCEYLIPAISIVSSLELVVEPSRQPYHAREALIDKESERNRMSVHGRRNDAQIHMYRYAAVCHRAAQWEVLQIVGGISRG